MNDFNFFVSVIEEVRKSKRIDIEDLTEGIVSSRTYKRYVYQQKEARISIIEKLLQKLDLKFSEVIFHYIHKSTGQSDMNMFMIHFKREHFDLCQPFYIKLKNKIDEAIDYSYLIQAYLVLYEFKLDMISSIDFTQQMVQLKDKMDALPLKTMYHHYFYILYTVFVNDNTTSILDELDFLLEKDNVSKRILQYLFLLPEVVKHMIKHKLSAKDIDKLIQVHKHALVFRQDIHCESDSFYIQALYYHYIGDELSKENVLYKYCIMQNVIGNKLSHELMEEVNRYFNVNCHQIIENKTPLLRK